jgi:putative spermidine/putrescine transport system substrate-binding protein
LPVIRAPSNQAIQGGLCRGPRGQWRRDGADRRRSRACKFFKELNAKGNFVPVIGKSASLAQGTDPDRHRLGLQPWPGATRFHGNPPPKSSFRRHGVVAGVYVQAISAYAPHPNAAKLWMEYLYSDEGQLGWLKGYCHPIRFNDLAKNGKIPQEHARQAAAGRSL